METKDMLKEVLLKYQGPLGQLLINLSGENGEKVFTELNKFNRKEPCWITASTHPVSKMNVDGKKKSILRCMGKNLSLKSLDGNRLICNSKDTFQAGINSNFVSWGINNAGIATPESLVQVHEMIGSGKFMDIFNALPGIWDEKWLSQDQIIEFCETFPDWLRPSGDATMFLVKKDEDKLIDENNPSDNLVVVYVSVKRGGPYVGVSRLKSRGVWGGEARHRVVSPQLIYSVV